MVKKKNSEIIKYKAQSRMSINYWLLGACFTFFIFSANINPELLRNNVFLSLQITLAIPLFMTSIFARSKLAYTKHFEKWDKYGFITFIFAYAFILNVIGILLTNIVSLKIGMMFFGANIFLDLFYSYMDRSEKQGKLKSLIYKDIFFIVALVLGGILPSLGFY